MGIFFIDTQSGQVATARQLVEAGVTTPANDDQPPRPWHRVQGTSDATTLWYAVMRKQTHGIFIGTLVIRHGDHHASLLEQGWEEVGVDEIRASGSTSSAAQEDEPPRAWP
ncbi:MAG: hypothetical protein JWQ20_202 [Conexibacter sp.]|nr:hypothetical protein [Conexibacter sp.]